MQQWVLIVYYFLTFVKIAWIPFIALDDLRRGILWFKHKITSRYVQSSETPKGDEGVSISRLKFLHFTGFGLGSALVGAGVYGIARGAHQFEVLERDLPIANLPSSFKGLRIAQISDIHCGSFWHRDAVQRGIALLLEQRPDIVFFTGDLVNYLSSEFTTWSDLFGKIQAPLGVYSVLGNHDYGDYHHWPDKLANAKPKGDKSHMSAMQKADHDALIQMHHDIGWNLLLNENCIIKRAGSTMAIIGVENWSAKLKYPRYGDLQRAYSGAEDADVKLLLSHDPSHWKAEVLPRFPDISATFSGHTHGMQMGVDTRNYRWSPMQYMYEEWIDLYSEKQQQLYVNRGFGYLGFPGRIGVNPEITIFTLKTA